MLCELLSWYVQMFAYTCRVLCWTVHFRLAFVFYENQIWNIVMQVWSASGHLHKNTLLLFFDYKC